MTYLGTRIIQTLLTLVLLALATALLAQDATDWITAPLAPDQASGDQPFEPRVETKGSDGSRYLIDSNNLLRIAPDGRQHLTRLMPHIGHGVISLQLLRPDRLVALHHWCQLRATDTSGQVVWLLDDSQGHCSEPLVTAEGSMLVLQSRYDLQNNQTMLRLLRISEHGQADEIAAFPNSARDQRFGLELRGDQSLTVAHHVVGQGLTVTALDQDGTTRWQQLIPESADNRLIASRVSAGGDIHLVHSTDAYPRQLRKTTVSSDGDIVLDVALEHPEFMYLPIIREPLAVHTDTGASYVLLHTQSAAVTLLHYAADGSLRWQQASSDTGSNHTIHLLSNDDVLWQQGRQRPMPEPDFDPFVTHDPRFVRYTSSGELIHALAFPGRGNFLGESANGGIDVWIRHEQESAVVQISHDGDVEREQSMMRTRSATVGVSVHLDQDGTSFAITGAPAASLSRIESDGRVAWERDLDAGSTPIPGSLAACGPDHLCFLDGSGMARVGRTQGAPVQRIALGEGLYGLHGYDSGAVLVGQRRFVSSANQWQNSLIWIGRDGNMRDVGVDTFDPVLAFHPAVGAVVRTDDTPDSRGLGRVDADGQLGALVDLDWAGIQWASLDQDGRLNALQSQYLPDESRYHYRLLKVVPDGDAQWRDLELPSVDDIIQRFGALTDGGIVVATRPATDPEAPSRLVRFDSDGEPRWASGIGWREVRAVNVDEDDNVAVLRMGHRGETRLEGYAGADGRLISTRAIECPEGGCMADHNMIDKLGILADGSVLFSEIRHARLGRASGLFEPATGVDLAQVGLDGLWYDPSAPGQGFSLAYFPQPRQLFMPWYTFDAGSGQQVDRQRWYTLQGEVVPGTREVTLPILAFEGVFGQSELTGNPVGEATLRFESCAAGRLDYRFEVDLGIDAGGSIPLARLLPATSDCQEADGGTSPATAIVDPRITGVWYDPANPGQGLHLFRHDGPEPAFFGAWYTFGPQQDAAPTSPQWLTLQSPVVEANGLLATLFRTRGGHVDGLPTGNTQAVGEARLQPVDCGRLLLEYRFDGDATLDPLAGEQGHITLHRIGDCPAD